VFSVKSAYLVLCSQANNDLHDIFSSLWQATAVPKALYTAWRILIGRLTTFDNLIRRGLAVSSRNNTAPLSRMCLCATGMAPLLQMARHHICAAQGYLNPL